MASTYTKKVYSAMYKRVKAESDEYFETICELQEVIYNQDKEYEKLRLELHEYALKSGTEIHELEKKLKAYENKARIREAEDKNNVLKSGEYCVKF
jgi:hypothetical protein